MLLALSACSSRATKPDPRWSKALTIARAAGFKAVHDVDTSKLKNLDPNKGSTFEAAEAIGKAAGIVPPTRGIPSPVEAVFLLLDSGPKPRLEDHTRVLAWMRADEFASRADAAAKMREIWTRAVASALPNAKVDLTVNEKLEKPKWVSARIYRSRYISIEMPDCEKCNMRSPVLDYKSALPKKTTAPAFLGSYPAYFWGGMTRKKGASTIATFGFPASAKNLSADERLAFLCRFSAALPDWAFVYVAPEKPISEEPLILDHGRYLEFSQPGIDDPVEEFPYAQNRYKSDSAASDTCSTRKSRFP